MITVEFVFCGYFLFASFFQRLLIKVHCPPSHVLFIRIRSHEYSFYSVCYKTLLSLFSCSPCSRLTTEVSFKLVLLFFWHTPSFLSTSLVFVTAKCFRLCVCFFCPNVGVNYFPKSLLNFNGKTQISMLDDRTEC